MTAKAKGARAIALVGPSGSGKTTLLEALLFAAGAVDRQGSVEGRNSIGDGCSLAMLKALLTSSRCVNACGKFPRWRPVLASTSSA